MPRLVILFVCLALTSSAGFAVETVRFDDNGQTRQVVAEVLVEAQDGGLMLQSDDGRIWIIQPEDIQERQTDSSPLVPISADEMHERLLQELPRGFKVYRTQHYIIVYNSSEAYVKQVGLLFEQLYRGFFTYWKNQKWQLPEPRFPLVGLVLKDHQAFLNHARGEIGDTANSLIGYYNLTSNRMTTFNVPNWERNAATIIHEATHQLAYNCGLQKRFADNPMWVSEGLATFFESPDRRNPGRWQRIGRVNQRKLQDWKRYLPRRPSESLATLLADDSRYRSAATAADAYAEGWALTYFLIRTRRKEYVNYLRELSEGKPLAELSQRDRIEMFERVFGTTLAKLDRAFVTYMRTVR
ncbi:MAG: DUF1570 domain-containing protein [Pirellulales bacterium]|nr:DUF1570 domain-containing protein [Pirellulales bacterium]